MNPAEVKIDLIKQISSLPEASLLELQEIIKKFVSQQEESKKKKKRQFGSMKGLVTYMAPDFNAPLDEFKEYM